MSLSGVYISYYRNLPSGPAIVLVSSTLFLFVLLFSPSQEILIRPALKQSLANRIRRSQRSS